MRLFKFVFILLSFFYAQVLTANWLFQPSDVNALHSKPADVKVSYGQNKEQYAELRLPSGEGPFKVAIIIHGGCWVSSFASLQNTAAIADALREQGIATWNMEYRREDQQGGGWPGTFKDIGNAADYLRVVAKRYPLDLKNVVVVGHSAGGHLALWLGARKKLTKGSDLYTPNPLVINGIIVLGGVPDLRSYRNFAIKVCGSDVIGNLLGKAPRDIQQHYKEASPIELLPLGIPQFFLFGAEDKAAPLIKSSAYISKSRQAGDTVKLMIIPYAGHHEYIVPNSVVWPSLFMAINSILKIAH